jgi:hypothetical protein
MLKQYLYLYEDGNKPFKRKLKGGVIGSHDLWEDDDLTTPNSQPELMDDTELNQTESPLLPLPPPTLPRPRPQPPQLPQRSLSPQPQELPRMQLPPPPVTFSQSKQKLGPLRTKEGELENLAYKYVNYIIDDKYSGYADKLQEEYENERENILKKYKNIPPRKPSHHPYPYPFYLSPDEMAKIVEREQNYKILLQMIQEDTDLKIANDYFKDEHKTTLSYVVIQELQNAINEIWKQYLLKFPSVQKENLSLEEKFNKFNQTQKDDIQKQLFDMGYKESSMHDFVIKKIRELDEFESNPKYQHNLKVIRGEIKGPLIRMDRYVEENLKKIDEQTKKNYKKIYAKHEEISDKLNKQKAEQEKYVNDMEEYSKKYDRYVKSLSNEYPLRKPIRPKKPEIIKPEIKESDEVKNYLKNIRAPTQIMTENAKDAQSKRDRVLGFYKKSNFPYIGYEGNEKFPFVNKKQQMDMKNELLDLYKDINPTTWHKFELTLKGKPIKWLLEHVGDQLNTNIDINDIPRTKKDRFERRQKEYDIKYGLEQINEYKEKIMDQISKKVNESQTIPTNEKDVEIKRQRDLFDAVISAPTKKRYYTYQHLDEPMFEPRDYKQYLKYEKEYNKHWFPSKQMKETMKNYGYPVLPKSYDLHDEILNPPPEPPKVAEPKKEVEKPKPKKKTNIEESPEEKPLPLPKPTTKTSVSTNIDDEIKKVKGIKNMTLLKDYAKKYNITFKTTIKRPELEKLIIDKIKGN